MARMWLSFSVFTAIQPERSGTAPPVSPGAGPARNYFEPESCDGQQ